MLYLLHEAHLYPIFAEPTPEKINKKNEYTNQDVSRRSRKKTIYINLHTSSYVKIVPASFKFKEDKNNVLIL